MPKSASRARLPSRQLGRTLNAKTRRLENDKSMFRRVFMLRQALLSTPAHLSREAAMFAAGTTARGTTQPAAGEDNAPGGEACGKNGDANFRVGPDLGLAVG